MTGRLRADDGSIAGRASRTFQLGPPARARPASCNQTRRGRRVIHARPIPNPVRMSADPAREPAGAAGRAEVPASTGAVPASAPPAPPPGGGTVVGHMHHHHHRPDANPVGRQLAVLTLTALGVVYGDIGTS